MSPATRIRCSVISVLYLLAVVEAQISEKACLDTEAAPVAGDALLQHSTNHASVKRHLHKKRKHTVEDPHEGSFLSQAYKALNDTFCNAPPPTRRVTLLDEFEDSAYPGVNAPLNASGFEQVMKKDAGEMKIFVRRLAERCHMKVLDEGGLNGAVSWFTSKKIGDIEKVKESMFRALLANSKEHWISVANATGNAQPVSGESAPLDVVGYVKVRALRSKNAMVVFLRRMIDDMGIRIKDEGGFEGLLKFYIEPNDSGSYYKLVSDIKKAASKKSWAELDLKMD